MQDPTIGQLDTVKQVFNNDVIHNDVRHDDGCHALPEKDTLVLEGTPCKPALWSRPDK
jgi:hypothetical protein